MLNMKNVDIILFGGMGDLSLRKLLPSLYRTEVCNQFTGETRIVLTAHSDPGSRDEWTDKIYHSLKSRLSHGELQHATWEKFRDRLHLIRVDIANINEGWDALAATLTEKPSDQENDYRVFYMAIPPRLYGSACEHLSDKKLITENARIVLEKPIGYDLETAKEINDAVAKYFPENTIYRIDHYLGKEAVQNLLVLRLTNPLFEQLWDFRAIDNVQITLAETVGLESRAGFYDQAGAVRDMVQNHLLQLLSLIAMDPPNNMDADSIRAEKLKVLKALRPIKTTEMDEHVVRGQYSAGVVDGKSVNSYQEELGKTKKSTTETYVAIKAHIDSWRWSGVPFYLRTGKRLQARYAEIVIQFKSVPHNVYGNDSGPLEPNKLVIRLQPEETIELTLMTKDLNQSSFRVKPLSLSLDFGGKIDSTLCDPYKRLLLDVIDDNQTLFAHREEVEHSWRWIDPMLKAWQETKTKPQLYPSGSRGPDQADALLSKNGHSWYTR